MKAHSDGLLKNLSLKYKIMLILTNTIKQNILTNEKNKEIRS